MAAILPLVLFILLGQCSRRHVSGRDHYLSLDPKPLNELTEWLVKSRDFWTTRVDALEAALSADDAVAVAKKSSMSGPARSGARTRRLEREYEARI
jgi:hypothetical protein